MSIAEESGQSYYANLIWVFIRRFLVNSNLEYDRPSQFSIRGIKRSRADRKLISQHWYKKLTARAKATAEVWTWAASRQAKVFNKIRRAVRERNPKQSKQTNKVDGYYENEQEIATRLSAHSCVVPVQNVCHNASIITILGWGLAKRTVYIAEFGRIPWRIHFVWHATAAAACKRSRKWATSLNGSTKFCKPI